MKQYKLLQLFTALFVTTLIISNTIASKIITIGPFDVDAGTLIFPLSYIFGDILTEVYGYKQTKKIIRIWFVCLAIMASTYSLAVHYPPAWFREWQAWFVSTLGSTRRIVVASIVAYRCWEFTNSYILSKLKLHLHGKKIGFRFVLSTIVWQLSDTSVFVIIAFLWAVSIDVLWSMFIWWWVLKVLREIVALPITLPLVNIVKKYEHEDYYDKNIDYNPFWT